MSKTPLKVAGVFFALVALLHLFRILWNVEIIIAGALVPLWLNGIAFAVTGLLSLWMFRSSK